MVRFLDYNRKEHLDIRSKASRRWRGAPRRRCGAALTSCRSVDASSIDADLPCLPGGRRPKRAAVRLKPSVRACEHRAHVDNLEQRPCVVEPLQRSFPRRPELDTHASAVAPPCSTRAPRRPPLATRFERQRVLRHRRCRRRVGRPRRCGDPPGCRSVRVADRVPDWRAALREEAGEGTALRRLIYRYYAAFVAQIMQSVACNGLHSVQQRCCRWLLRCLEPNTTRLPITHESLGPDAGRAAGQRNRRAAPLAGRGTDPPPPRRGFRPRSPAPGAVGLRMSPGRSPANSTA